MNWKDKFIINIQKQSNLVCNSQTIYDDETIDKEISFEELVKDQSLIGQYAKNATEQEIAELIEKHGLELTERSLMTLLKTVRPLLIIAQHNIQLVKEIFEKNPSLKSKFKTLYDNVSKINDAAPKNIPKYEEVKIDGARLMWVPIKFRTPDICWAAVEQNGRALEFVPPKLITPELCWVAIKQNGGALFAVPPELRTEELCWAAVEQNGKALYSVHWKLITPALCLTAVKQNWTVLKAVPGGFVTPELCLAAIEQDGEALRDVPEYLMTPEICLTAVQKNSCALKYVPEEFRTSEIYWAAIKQNGSELYNVPWELRTHDICLAAVKQDHRALNYIPYEIITKEMCSIYLKHDGSTLRDLPRDLISSKMCWDAVKKNATNLKYAPEKLITRKMCLTAIQQNGLMLNDVPWELRTPDLCLIAVQQSGTALAYVPEKLKTTELCSVAVTVDYNAIKHVPWTLRTEELYWTALKENPAAIQHVPEDVITHDMCLHVIKKDAKYLRNLPKKLMTPEIYFAAIKNIVPDSCKAFYKYFIIQMKEGISTFHDFENSFFTTKELLSKQNSQKYHWDSFFSKFSSNNAMELYKLFNKKKDLVDYKVDKIENIDTLSSDGINKLYSTYIFPIKQAELLKNAPKKMHDYLKTIEYLLDEGKTNANRLIDHFEQIPSKSEIKEKHEVLKHRIMEINGFKFEILDRADETGLILGNLTGCCQKLGGGNSDAVYDGFLNPNSNFLAVYYKDRLIAQSWLRLGKSNVLYLDNIESNAPFSVEYKENFNKEKYELLKSSFIEFAQTMKREYKLLNVIVGKGYSDVTFDELLLDTPTVKEDFVGKEDLTSDLENDRNYIIANIRRSKMKIVKANKNKLRVTLSKTEWQQIGKKAGWVKKADTNSKYLAAVQQNGYALKNIPQEDITLELCSEAVRQNSGAIKYVPHNMKIELVRKNGEFIKYIPKDSLTLELCSEAVRQSPAAIEYVPHHFKKHLR